MLFTETVNQLLLRTFEGGTWPAWRTGVYRDSKGNVVGFRIQNSWGKESGELGYYYMDVDYFDTFVRNLTFKRKIEIWDPSLE